MRAFAIAVVVALLLSIPAAAGHKPPATYPETFYVNNAVTNGTCVMDVTEGNIEYRLTVGLSLRYVCFNAGQTLQGRFLGGGIEIPYTNSKGKTKTVRYQIVSQRAL